MARKQESKLITGPLPLGGLKAPSGLAIDPTALPKPRPEAWSGWASAPQGNAR